MWQISPRKDVPTEERQNRAWGVRHRNAPAWGTNGRIKCAPTLCCKPNHFSWATMAPSGKREKKREKFFLTRNWFISHYSHFKRTGHSWFQRSLTKPHTFKGCEFWGEILIPPTAMGCALLAAVQCQSRNGDIQSSTEKTGWHIFNFALITNALAVYSGTFASLLLGTRDLHAFPL